MLNLDTHILIFALRGELTAHERKLLENNDWSFSAIVLWELAKLIQLGRIDMDLDDREVMRTLSSIHMWPSTSPSPACRRGWISSVTRQTKLIGGDERGAPGSPCSLDDRVIRRSKVVPLA